MQANQNDSYNRGGFRAFIFSMVFSLAFMAYVAFFTEGINLREIPEETSQAVQTMADGEKSAVDVSGVTNPWISSEDLIAHGAKSFQNNCAICHGPEGKGDGAAGKSLNPPPRNLVEGKWKKGGTSIALFNTVTNGIEGTSMAAFGHLPVLDRWAIVHWIRSITEDKPEDSPEKLEEFGKTAK